MTDYGIAQGVQLWCWDGAAWQKLKSDGTGIPYVNVITAAIVSNAVWIVETTNQVNVAAARTTHADLFNAVGSGKLIRVLGVYIVPTLTAVTGIGLTWEIIRTSDVGTGGTGITPVPYDSASAALPAQITARKKPAGGATTSVVWLQTNTSSEETIPYVS